MDLELHQLDRRYEALRTRSARRERRLLSSLSEVGQQTPIVVVRDSARWVVVDGYKRVRAVHRLGVDHARIPAHAASATVAT
jgi:ParB family transcriptional regulator, chromosome partitioning protein